MKEKEREKGGRGTLERMEDAPRRRVNPRFMVASRRPSSLAVTPFHLPLEKSDARTLPCATESHVVDVFLRILLIHGIRIMCHQDVSNIPFEDIISQ